MNGYESRPSRPPPPRRRYHFHTPGVLYVIVTFFLALGAINSQNNLLFASLGLAIGGLLTSGLVSGASLLGLRVSRLHLDHGRVGGTIRLRYQLRNTNRLVPAFGLTLTEAGRDTQAKLAREPKTFVAHLAPREEVTVEARIEPQRRGLLSFREVRIWCTFPFGLAKKSIAFESPGSTIIHPVELPVRQGVLERLTVRALTGVGSAVAAGAGDDFYGLREYVDGDNPRWIAWRRTARTGQLVVRQNTTPTPRLLWIVLRIPVEDRETPQVEQAIALASALVRACAREGAAVGLAVPTHGIAMAPRSAPRAIQSMMDRLALLDADRLAPKAAFPGMQVRDAANAVVHAGPVDRKFGTARTRHIGPDDFESLLVAGPRLSAALAILNAPEVPPATETTGFTGRVRRWVKESRP